MNQYSSEASRYAASTSPGSVVWFISFGDLLTLLLCFFLVLTPWEGLSRIPQELEYQQVKQQKSVATTLGIPLAQVASTGRSELLAEIPLYAEQVIEMSTISKAMLLATIEQELEPHTTSSTGVLTIVLCSPEINREQLLRQLLPLVQGPEFRGFRLEVELTHSCEGERIFRPVTAKVIGAVRVERT